MSTAQIQRLEGLLARVQQNRQARPVGSVGADASSSSFEMDEPAFETPKAKLEPMPEPRMSTKPVQPTPVAAPVVSIKPVPVAAPVAKAAPQPVAKPVTPEVAVARSIPVASPAVDPNAPARVVTSPAPPSAPIAQTTSAHPTMDGLSFGELLRRSLALRPR
jgi:outer membrane biosynthesis protein TonB